MRITQVIGVDSLEGEDNFAVAPIRGGSDIRFEGGTLKLLGGPANADGMNPSRISLPNHNSMADLGWGLEIITQSKGYALTPLGSKAQGSKPEEGDNRQARGQDRWKASRMHFFGLLMME